MAITKATTGSNTIYDDNLLLSTTHTLDLICPIGTILMWPKSTPPKGWLICNGGTFNQTIYPKLYAVLGNSTTLPNFQGRVPVGVGSVTSHGTFSPTLGGMGGEVKHTLTLSEMPSHRHSYMFARAGNVNADGSNDQRSWERDHPYDTTYTTPVGGNGSHNNIQPYYGIYFIIKAEHAIMN